MIPGVRLKVGKYFTEGGIGIECRTVSEQYPPRRRCVGIRLSHSALSVSERPSCHAGFKETVSVRVVGDACVPFRLRRIATNEERPDPTRRVVPDGVPTVNSNVMHALIREQSRGKP